MKLNRMTKTLGLGLLLFATSAYSATPTFTTSISGSMILVNASNNSNDAYSCNVKFDWFYLQGQGFKDSNGCTDPFGLTKYAAFVTTVNAGDSCDAQMLGNPSYNQTISVPANTRNLIAPQIKTGSRSPSTSNVIANCTIQAPVDNRANQTLFFQSSASAVNVKGTLTAKSTANSGSSNSITITSQTPSVCSSSTSIANVTGLAGGTCTLAANKAGDSKYKNAPQVTASITVNKLPQTITANAAPSSVAMGSTVTLSAQSSSGLPVSIPSVANSICNISSNGVVKGLSKGDCKVVVNQSGNAGYQPATQTFVIKVFNAAVLTPIIDLLLNDK